MKPEAQRMTIAKARGWSILYPSTMQGIDPSDGLQDTIPDYLNDLDAMNEVLVFLYTSGIRGMCGGQALSVYALELDKIMNRDFRGETSHIRLIATANRCAEALVRTLSLWEESSD